MGRATPLVVLWFLAGALAGPANAIGLATVESTLPIATRTVTADANLLYSAPSVSGALVEVFDKSGGFVSSYNVAGLASSDLFLSDIAYDATTDRLVGLAAKRLRSGPSQFETRLVEFSKDGSQLFSETTIVPVPPGWTASHSSKADGIHADADGWWVVRDSFDGVSYGPPELARYDRTGTFQSASLLDTRPVANVWGIGASANGNHLLFADALSNSTFLIEVDDAGNELAAWRIDGVGGAPSGGDVALDPVTGRHYAAHHASGLVHVIAPLGAVPEAAGLVPFTLGAMALAALATRRPRRP